LIDAWDSTAPGLQTAQRPRPRKSKLSVTPSPSPTFLAPHVKCGWTLLAKQITVPSGQAQRSFCAERLKNGFMLGRRLPPLNCLRVFQTVARHTTFRAAAKELNVTAAAVGQQVKSLENQLGRPLLLRQPRGGYLLTAEGRAGARALQVAFEQLASAVTLMSSSARRKLTVTTTPSLAAAWLVPRLKDFEQQYPEIDLLLHSSRDVTDLESRSADVALRFCRGAYEGTEATLLFPAQLFPVCSPYLLRGRGSISSPADLLNMPLLHAESRPPSGGRWLDWPAWLKATGALGAHSRRGMRFAEQGQAIQAAVAGRGVALATTALVVDHLTEGRLVRPLSLTVDTDFAYYVVTLKDRAAEADVVAFKRWVLGQAKH
jgi:LysR family transcriptional regulator, glycine cleavage system transcriptional activator